MIISKVSPPISQQLISFFINVIERMKGQDDVLKQHVFHLGLEAGLHLIHSGQILYLSCSKRSPGTMLDNPLCHLPVSRILVSIATLYPERCNFSANCWLMMLVIVCPVDPRLRSNSTLSGFIIHRLRSKDGYLQQGARIHEKEGNDFHPTSVPDSWRGFACDSTFQKIAGSNKAMWMLC